MGKRRHSLRWLLAAALLAACSAGSSGARAEEPAAFPSRSIRIIAPFAAGGTADILARTAAQFAGQETGWQFYVENITGAGGLVGAQAGARAPADGYTLLLCNVACAVSQFLLRETDWNPKTALAPVTVVGYVPNIMVVSRTVDIDSLKTLLDRARAKPGQVSIATNGPGSTSSMAANLLASIAGIQTLEITYRGSAAAMPDLISGRVDAMIMGLPESLSLVRDGTFRPLAVTSTERAPSVPDVPTMVEAGVPGYKFVGWLSLFVPKNTPDEIIAKLNVAFNKAIASPMLQKRFAEQSIQPVGGPADLAGRFLNEDIELWEPILRDRRK